MNVHHMACQLVVTGGLEPCDCTALKEATEKVRRCIGCGARDGFTSPLNVCAKCEAIAEGRHHDSAKG